MSRILLLLCVVSLAFGLNQRADAQAYPAKPVRLVVPFPAGGGSDNVGRVVAQKLSELLGQQVFVDNRAGAGGSIGTEVAVRSPPDGYTLVLASTSEIAVNPAIYSKLDYDTLKDLAPVAMVASSPMVLIVSPSLPVKTVGDFIALAKAKPGELNIASAGNGSFTHLSGELFRSMTGLSWTHVPYKGAPPAIGDLAGGRVDAMFSTMPAAMGSIKGALVKAIAISSRMRMSALPDVPTFIESGVPGYEPEYWYGVFVPAATPKEIVAKLGDAVAKAVQSPEVAANLVSQGASPATMPSAQFAGYVKQEVARWGKVVKDSGAKVD
ncbi:MAG TPA: tripartite tricarboxylate transporter substrate binding protein [Casimicrobiaceae bacterium]|nr:tripartite tricarboxylate transporter substrate binding protein [Casimicrobiaceae bacterium]